MTGPPQAAARSARREGGIVLVKGIAGMGNRILALLGASLYARLTGRRLLVDWRDGMYAGAGVNAFAELFCSRSADAVTSSPVTDSVAPWMWRGRLDAAARAMQVDRLPSDVWFSPFAGRLFSIDVRTLDHPEEVVVIWSLHSFVGALRRHLTGPWEPWGRLADPAIEARLLDEFELHPAIAERVEAIRKTCGGGPTVGVHVRHTDRRTNPARLTHRLDALLASRPGSRLFLATDDEAVQDHFSRRYPGLVTVPKWFSPSGAIHLFGSGCTDRSAMARDALVEMFLLARCDDVVLDGDSTFAQIVKLLWKGDPRRVIDIRSLSWLPHGVRDRLWRARDWLRWGRRLRALGMPLRPPREVAP